MYFVYIILLTKNLLLVIHFFDYVCIIIVKIKKFTIALKMKIHAAGNILKSYYLL